MAEQEYTVIRFLDGGQKALLAVGACSDVSAKLNDMSERSTNGFVAAEVEVAMGWNLAGSTFHVETDPPTEVRTINLANVVSMAPAKMA